MNPRIPEQEYAYIQDRLCWAEQMLHLRIKYADTPAGFTDESSRCRAEEQIRKLREAWEEAVIGRLMVRPWLFDEQEVVVRRALLSLIHRSFTTGHCVTILHGMGGIGKSILAKSYASRYAAEYDAILLWNCENGFREAIFDDNQLRISNMCYTRERDSSRLQYTSRKLRMLREIAGRQKLLILLDNCDFLSDRFMKRVFAIPADFLVTTRVDPGSWESALPADWAGIPLPPDGFETEEEWTSFAERFGRKDWQTAVKACYGNILKVKLALRGGDYDILRSGKLSFGEKKLLAIIAIMPLDGIPEPLLQEIAEKAAPALQKLLRRGLAERTAQGRISMHPLIREEALRTLDLSQLRLANMIRALADKVYNAWERTYEENLALEPYALAVLRAFPDYPPYLAREFDIFITLLWVQCRYEEALEYSLKLYGACEKRYGHLHELTGFCVLRTGAVYRNAGLVEEAQRWFLDAYDILRQLPPDTPGRILGRIEALSRLCLILEEQGDLTAAQDHARQKLLLAKMLKERYPDHVPGYRGNPSLEYPYALLKIGEYHLMNKDYEAALNCQERAYAALKETNTSVYREVEFIRLKIRIFLGKGDARSALPLAERSLSIVEKHRGTISREYLRAGEQLADVLAACKDYAGAAGQYGQILEILSACYPRQQAWMTVITQKWQKTY